MKDIAPVCLPTTAGQGSFNFHTKLYIIILA